ncbi:MAG TPA: GTPase Era [Candidatus Caccenecus avistercoris]|nr:GTPase Era [Candidatus Caccenecus avistercoris]
MKSGFVSIIGRPNVGKSTLLNTLINEKVAITSKVAGTTRNVIQGIYNESDYQIVFLDTPGIIRPMNKLGKITNKQAMSLVKDIDCLLFVVDASTGLGKGDMFIMDVLKKSDSPVILVLNKIDKISDEDILYNITEYKDLYPFAEIVPVSALTKDNIKRLIDVIKKYLKDDVKYFPEGMKTSNSKYFMISEIVREKLFDVTVEEIPHSLTCHTSLYEEKKDIINIHVDIIVDRDTIKKIIIGKKGERLKDVGTRARVELEAMLGKKVYLELFVKTIKNWKDKERYIKELGFYE